MRQINITSSTGRTSGWQSVNGGGCRGGAVEQRPFYHGAQLIERPFQPSDASAEQPLRDVHVSHPIEDHGYGWGV